MNILIDNWLNEHVKLGKEIGSQVVVLSQALGLHAERTSGLVDVTILDGYCEMFAGTVTATIVLTIGQIYNL